MIQVIKIIRKINNNIVIYHEDDRQVIATGKGIGFNKYPGDMVKKQLIEQRYILQQSMSIEAMKMFLQEVPMEIIVLSDTIIKTTTKALKKELNPQLIINLSDHINYAIERSERNIVFTHPLKWEVQRVYIDEYKCAEDAVLYLNEQLGIHLPEEEIVYIAMHFVNALLKHDSVQDVAIMTEAISEIVQILQYHFHIIIDETSLDYSRFVTHLRFFIQRQNLGQDNDAVDEVLYQLTKERYPEIVVVLQKIQALLEHEFSWTLSQSEKFYLILHINRLVSKKDLN